MEFELRLYDGRWYVNGYVITGNKDDGYTVFEEPANEDDDPETLYGDKDTDFESAMVWCFNN